MCGIAAVLANPSAVDFEPLAGRLITAMRHRGPDMQAHLRNLVSPGRELLLVHTRLAILDLSPAGNQPMQDGDTNNVIIFNGEIYNYAELRSELARLDPVYHYRSTSDTEVLLRSYAYWGIDVLSKLDGIFSFILLDTRRRKLVVARDHIGIKPLYYAHTPGCGWIFASEVRALLASRLCGCDLDSQAIADYLRLGAIQEPATIFAGVRAFPAGHLAEISLDVPAIVEPRPYWDARPLPGIVADAERHPLILAQTMNEQMVADVPVGLFLSAGIDSTALATLAANRAGGRLQTFTIGSSRDNEAVLASETARCLGLPHHVYSLGEDESIRWMLEGLDAMDQPSSDGINTYLVSRASRNCGMVVTLSGTGADELHGGYSHFYSLPKLHRWLASAPGRTLAPGILRLFGRSTQAERLELLLNAPNMAAMVDEQRRFFTPQWILAHGPAYLSATTSAAKNGTADVQTEIALAELAGYLRNTLLRDSDWATMANSQELRVPYLGRRYIEFMLTVPWSTKNRHGQTNKPLLANLIPESCRKIIHRPKTGFNLDYAALLLGPHRVALAEATVTLNRHGFHLDNDVLLTNLDRTHSLKYARRLWALLALGRYLQRHLPQS